MPRKRQSVDPEQPRPPALRGLLATRGRKIAAVVGAAFLAGVGSGIAAWVVSATKEAVRGGPGLPLQIRVARSGTFFSGADFAPYDVIPVSRVAGPAVLTRAQLIDQVGDEGVVDFGWAQEHGGVAGSPQVVRLEIRARTDEPVTITAIKAIVLRRRPPVDGWYVVSPSCGPEPVRAAEVDLDAPVPNVVYTSADGSTQGKELAFTVTRTDLELIEIHAVTRSERVAWRAEVFYSGPNGDGSIAVDDGGRPFVVTTERRSAGFSPDSRAGRALKLRRRHDWDRVGIQAC